MDLSATLSVVLAVATITIATAVAVAVIVARARRVQQISKRTTRRSRRHELHWTAIRYRNQGILGADLQEVVCRQANCSPGEADAAIVRVGADL
ncbi:MAG: hypothetical protein GY925_11540 [Actinomycetia bacterium]|nr:hypothetical protein [Actinomycetes bacterium]